MKKLLAPVFLLALLAAILSGCTNVSQIIVRGLKIELTGLEHTNDGTMSATWRVVNSNVSSYLLSRVSHKIYLNGIYLGTILDEEPMGVPASNEVIRTSKLTGGDAAAARVLAEAAASGLSNYRMETQIIIRIYGDQIEKAALVNSGTVPVTQK